MGGGAGGGGWGGRGVGAHWAPGSPPRRREGGGLIYLSIKIFRIYFYIYIYIFIYIFYIIFIDLYFYKVTSSYPRKKSVWRNMCP